MALTKAGRLRTNRRHARRFGLKCSIQKIDETRGSRFIYLAEAAEQQQLQQLTLVETDEK
jgi:hypothetical protein